MHNREPEWRRLYPFQSHHTTIGEWQYHFLDEGSGAPLLMVHGNPTWSFYWRNLVLAFREKFRVVVPDHLGCGLSDKPQDYDYCLDNHISNLAALLRELDLREVTLLVHDWGGAIGLGAALAEPARIKRLVLFNTGAFPPPFIPLRIRACRTPLLGSWGIRQLNLFARAAIMMAVEERTSISADAAAGLLAPYDNWEHRVAIDAFVRDIPLTRSHRTWQSLDAIEQGLSSLVDLPTLLIWGMRDWCFRPECLTRFQRLLPNAETHELEKAGHYVIEEAHQQIIPLVDEFLARTA